MSITKFKECANCGACYNMCTQDAIFVNDEKTFYRVMVDKDKCIECGLCEKICPINVETDTPQIQTQAYFGKHIDKDVVASSSSGGAFAAFSKIILEESGIVFSAGYTDDFKRVVFKNTDETPLHTLMRSKYVESSVNTAFRQIENELSKERKVLFCGTPCQVAGLKAYLKKEYKNLVVVDFLCGGLASHKMYLEHICDKEKTYGSKIENVNFRPKTAGWEEHALLIDFKNGKKYEQPMALDPYFYSFVSAHLNVRDYCYKCKFANKHISDITLADFWKYRKVTNSPKNHDGLSQVLVNTFKGQQLLEKAFSSMNLNFIKSELIVDVEARTPTISVMNKRKEFLKTYEKKGLQAAAVDAGMSIGKTAIKIKIKYYIKKNIVLLKRLVKS